MAYAKSWTDKYNDGWYLSLKLHERGLWDQLFTYAKMVGDTGRITGRSWSAWGSLWGCDGKTCRKILRNFHAAGKVVLTDRGKFLELEIVNYEYYQRVKKVGDGNTQGKTPEISPLKQSRAEQSSIPLSAPLAPKKKKDTDPRIKLFIDYWFQDYGKVFPGEKYVVQGGKDASAVKRLLGTAPLEDMQAAASWFLRFESSDFLGQLAKEISLFVMKYNEIRQRVLSEKNQYARPPM